MSDLVQSYGEKIYHPLTNEETFLFPTPEILVEASLEEIKTTTQRKKSIKELCQNLIEKKLVLRNTKNQRILKDNSEP